MVLDQIIQMAEITEEMEVVKTHLMDNLMVNLHTNLAVEVQHKNLVDKVDNGQAI